MLHVFSVSDFEMLSGYMYCSSHANLTALMPRSGPSSGFDPAEVCSWCIDHLMGEYTIHLHGWHSEHPTVTASGRAQLKNMPLAKLRKYLDAYNIKSERVIEKADLVDLIIAARVWHSLYVYVITSKLTHISRDPTAVCLGRTRSTIDGTLYPPQEVPAPVASLSATLATHHLRNHAYLVSRSLPSARSRISHAQIWTARTTHRPYLLPHLRVQHRPERTPRLSSSLIRVLRLSSGRIHTITTHRPRGQRRRLRTNSNSNNVRVPHPRTPRDPQRLPPRLLLHQLRRPPSTSCWRCPSPPCVRYPWA
jgi:hypothetical protein